MSGSNDDERLTAALKLLRDGLRPYVEREMTAEFGANWSNQAAGVAVGLDSHEQASLDVYVLLKLMSRNWNAVFSHQLGTKGRNLVEELRNTRNDWAHQKVFSAQDSYRALDSIERLLHAVGAEPQEKRVKRLLAEVLPKLTLQDSEPRDGEQALRRGQGSDKTYHNAGRYPATTKGKYRPLHDHLVRQQSTELKMSFREIEDVIGAELPPSARQYQAWWANENLENTVMVQKRAWLSAGFSAHPDLASDYVVFRRERQ